MHMRFGKQLAILISLLLTIAANAQTSFCRTSFSFRQATQSNIPIIPAGTGAWSQFYNTNGYTWEAWFRLRAPIVNNSIIISTEDAVPYQDVFLGFGWGSIPNALCFHITDDGTSNTVVDAESLQTFALNTWYHVAGVCDYANATLRLYLNGNLIATKAIPANVLAHRMSQNHSTFIGNASASASASDIDIDEVRFWNTVRTQSDIQSAMTQCLSLPQTGLVAWFKANEAGAPTAKSAVDANFTATLQNAGYGPSAPVSDCFTMTIGQTPTSCKGIDFAATVSSGITVLDYSWDFGDGNTGSGQNTSHTYTSFGNKTITLDAKDNAGCGATTTLILPLNPAYVYDNKNIDICQGQTFLGHTSSATFTSTITSPDGCDTMRTYNLTVKDKPDLGPDQSTDFCEGSSVALPPLFDLTGFTSIRWNNPDPQHAIAGTDSLFVSNSEGCSDTAVVTVIGHPKPQLGPDQNIDVCYSTSVNLDDLYDVTSFSSATWSTPTVSNVGPGSYTLIVSNNSGCTDTAIATIKQYPLIRTVIDTSLCETTTIEGYTKPGSYTDIFHAANGCDSTRILNITACEIFFPNAFSPNGDGNNDLFKAINATGLTDFHLTIYNRWGQQVFETTNPTTAWNGQINNKPAPPGSYIYFCEYAKRQQPQHIKLKGMLLLLR
ncbi:MAG: gliding motility-associated C-terminal domain-containing protein [Bacteroidetes bacterium]|nr:gliding motility-associated C-terminal domain-containing protein [Bacteroidota bacterium]